MNFTNQFMPHEKQQPMQIDTMNSSSINSLNLGNSTFSGKFNNTTLSPLVQKTYQN